MSYSNTSLAKPVGSIAIIIDDMGYNRNNQAFLKLPKSITFAILPYTPFSQTLANSAQQQNREIILHIPMQAHSHNHLLGKGALMEEMTKQDHQHSLHEALLELPNAIGVNNHMGSQLTEDKQAMQWTMELLSKQGLFFVDSFTSADSVAETSAVNAGLPGLRRNIFLDNIRTQQAMNKQFNKAIKHSHQSANPHTIIIAHPYPETLAYLSQRLAAENPDFQLVKLSQLLSNKQRIFLDNKKVQYRHKHQLDTNQKTVKVQ